ncbi:MAG: hypothetical protein JRG91_13740 [Deltaproteobacteria bacterium]|nr:hypothetical protein [Deltaproteobacteria bacterium]
MRCAPAVIVLSFLLLSCSAGVKKQEAEEPIADQVAAAVEPAPQAGTAIEQELIGKIGTCWFRKPYSYMFGSSAPIDVGGTSFGMLLAGIGGILYYGDLNQCFAEQMDTGVTSYSDNKPFAKMSGLPIHSDRMDGSQPFGLYNPDIVVWGYTNLIPAQTDLIAGVPAQTIYSGVFSRFFRMMTESHLYLVQSGTYRQEMDAYWKMANQTGQDGIDYLQARYQGTLPDYGGSWDGTSMTPQMAIGFWLRRGLDGTNEELWTGLKKVMLRFDGQWYAGLRSTYNSNDIVW